jgi:hypothetical protein
MTKYDAPPVQEADARKNYIPKRRFRAFATFVLKGTRHGKNIAHIFFII